MGNFSKSSTGLLHLLLLSIIACSTVLINPTHARAGLFDTEEEGDGWGWGFGSNEKSDDEQQGRSSDHNDHDGHHHGHDSILAAGLPQAWDPAKQAGAGAGMQGGNFAYHNESCSPAGKSCVEGQNLRCSATDGTGRCICVDTFVYVRQTETCWIIPKSDQDICHHDIQCHVGKWAAHSRCNKQTSRCECYDYSTGGKRNMTLVNGVCYIKKSVGALCRNHEECDKTIEGGAYCKLGEHQSSGGQSYNGSCQCKDTHMFWGQLNSCLKLSTKLNDKCTITEQCQEGSLGQRSKCMPHAGGICQCYSPHNGTEVVYYEKLAKCFKKKMYNDTCNEANECRASLGPDVECDKLEPEQEDKVCHCPQGKECKNSAFSTLFASSLYTLGFACTAAVVGVSSLLNGVGSFRNF